MRKRIWIKGPKVHDLGYRLFLLEEADRLGLTGFDAKNLVEEGMQVIEILVEGEDRRVDSFLNFVKTSRPEGAEITEVVVENYGGEVRSMDSFYRSFSASQLSKIVTIGLSMLKEQREMRVEMREGFNTLGNKIDTGFKELRSEMREGFEGLRSEMREGFNTLGNKIDTGFKESINRHDQILKEIRNLRTDLRSYIEERLQRLEKDVRMIKERLGIE